MRWDKEYVDNFIYSWHDDLGEMSRLPGVPGGPGCPRINIFSYKLGTDDRLTDFDFRRVQSGFRR